jgi:choline dehydrogenase-like flavoprotein
VQSGNPAYWELDPDLFVNDADHPYQTPFDAPFQWIRSRQFNGRMLTWGGIGLRVSDFELRAPEQDGFGEPWPFGYAELAPFYDEIDAALPVFGRADGLRQIPDGNYVGACPMTEPERRFADRISEQFPERSIVPSRGVLVRPSSRPAGEAGPPSLARQAVVVHGASLRTDAIVVHLTTDHAGRPTGVAVVDRRTLRTYEIRARTVVLCASTIESTRILLNSRSPQHPDGIGNSSGVLGRYLMDHPGVYVSGYLPGERDAVWTGGTGGPKNILIPRFHNLENRADGDFLRGYGMFGSIGRHRSRPDAGNDCGPQEVPFTLVAYGEMLPRETNRVELVENQTDAWGVPVPRITCTFSANETAMRRHMLESLREMVVAADGRVTDVHEVVPGGLIHEVGTARMGTDPTRSVLNGFAQCWDAPNVFVLDGAAWPSGAWQNPTFTMMAIAGRACDYLVTELRSDALSGAPQGL